MPAFNGTSRTRFLSALELTGCVKTARRHARLAHSVVYRHRESDAQFAEEWDAALSAYDMQRHAEVVEAAKTDWKAAAWLLEKREDQGKAALGREKLRADIARAKADTELAKARLAGTLPAEKHQITTVDLNDPDAVQRRIDELLALRRGADRTVGASGTDATREGEDE